MPTKCLVCNNNTQYFFSKDYSQSQFSGLMKDIGPITYNRCDFCGFTFSTSHQNLSNERWLQLNEEYHRLAQNQIDILPRSGKPPYLEQAMMLTLLHKHKLINLDSAIDYAAGDGALSQQLKKYFSVSLPIYEQYITSNNSNNSYSTDIKGSQFETVINSAMFEHITTRSGIDDVNALVAENGCLVLHSVICENIPQDPAWFYLDPPVHSAFFTNKSLTILMSQWGYQSSVYCPQAKSWVLFKSPSTDYKDIFMSINQGLKNTWFLYKEHGFLDYWKGF